MIELRVTALIVPMLTLSKVAFALVVTNETVSPEMTPESVGPVATVAAVLPSYSLFETVNATDNTF